MSDPTNLPPKLGTPASEAPKNWWSRLPRWTQWSVGVVGVLILLGIGAAVGGAGGKESELKDEIAALESELSSAETQAEAGARAKQRIEAHAVAMIEKAKGQAESLISEARDSSKSIFAAARNEKTKFESEAESEEAKTARVTSEAESMETKIADLRGEVGEAKEYKAKSTIPGDGTYVNGKDYESGTYESAGGNLCSWEADQVLGGEANGEGFNDNYGLGETHILIEITAPYFKTSRCGTWHRVE